MYLQTSGTFPLLSWKIGTLDISAGRVYEYFFLYIPTNNRFYSSCEFLQSQISKLIPHYCFILHFSDYQYFCWSLGCGLWIAYSYLPIVKFSFSCLTQLLVPELFCLVNILAPFHSNHHLSFSSQLDLFKM